MLVKETPVFTLKSKNFRRKSYIEAQILLVPSNYGGGKGVGHSETLNDVESGHVQSPWAF